MKTIALFIVAFALGAGLGIVITHKHDASRVPFIVSSSILDEATIATSDTLTFYSKDGKLWCKNSAGIKSELGKDQLDSTALLLVARMVHHIEWHKGDGSWWLPLDSKIASEISYINKIDPAGVFYDPKGKAYILCPVAKP